MGWILLQLLLLLAVMDKKDMRLMVVLDQYIPIYISIQYIDLENIFTNIFHDQLIKMTSIHVLTVATHKMPSCGSYNVAYSLLLDSADYQESYQQHYEYLSFLVLIVFIIMLWIISSDGGSDTGDHDISRQRINYIL